MEYVALGKSNLLVSRTGFGAMSLDSEEIERYGDKADEKAACLVHQAYEGGINFFDTAHSKPVCEKRIGSALSGIRQNVFLARKTAAQSGEQITAEITESLKAVATDFIDLYQIENQEIMPQEDGVSGIYKALCELQAKGTIKHFGIATENIQFARDAIKSGLYETIQFPFNLLSGEEVVDLVKMCHEQDVGFIGMQPLCGGVVSNIPLAFGFLRQFENAIPLWGVRTPEELQQILYFEAHPPVIDEQFKSEAQKVREFFN